MQYFLDKNPTNSLEEIMWILKSYTQWSIKKLSLTLRSSETTIHNVLHGHDTDLRHYREVIGLLLDSSDWVMDFSELPEVVDYAFKNNMAVVAGVYDPDKKEIVLSRFILMKEKL